MDDQMEFEEPLPEEAPTIIDPGTLGNNTVRMTESQIQVGNMGEKYKVATVWSFRSLFVYLGKRRRLWKAKIAWSRWLWEGVSSSKKVQPEFRHIICYESAEEGQNYLVR